MKSTSRDVARYYDRNTGSFLARGQGGAEGVIHRAVWGEGVQSREEAFHFVHRLILAELDPGVGQPRVLDLGCGVGASLVYLLQHTGGEGFGITVSRLQADLAQENVPANLSHRVTIGEGDFCGDALPPSIDLAYGIESFVQATEADAFFERVAQALRPGGKLALCDDFLVEEDSRWVPEFRWGWYAASLATTEAVDRMAAKSGLTLTHDRDLTPLLELDRPRDRALSALVAVGRPLGLRGGPRWRSLRGGNALRQCLKRGLVNYRFRVWRKAPGGL